MTIATSSNFTRALGTGAATAFDFSFVADSASYVSVDYYTGSSFVETITTSLYTLFINPPATGQIWGIGGTVVYPLTGTPVPLGDSLLIQRTLPLTQVISISNQGPFAQQVIEEALDTLCMQIQQVAGTGAGDSITGTDIITALGYTPMNGANNLSEITIPATARTNLALGTMAVQNATAVAVTGGTISGVGITGSSFAGTIDNTVIGGSTRAAGSFTTLLATTSFNMVTSSGATPVTWAFINGADLGSYQFGATRLYIQYGLDSFAIITSTGVSTTYPITATGFIPTSSTIPTNGVYLSAANTVSIAGNTTRSASFTSTGMNNTIIGATTAAAATFTTVVGSSFRPISGVAPTNGVYLPGSNTVGISANSTGVVSWDSASQTLVGDHFATGNFQVITNASSGLILKRGANGRVGTVTLTGTTAVTVNNTSIATSDIIAFSLAVVGGTPAGAIMKTITAASGFTVAGTVGDTSTYNFCITKSVI